MVIPSTTHRKAEKRKAETLKVDVQRLTSNSEGRHTRDHDHNRNHSLIGRASARLRILQGLFPQSLQSPAESELQLVSDRFKLAGGSLKNIVLDAAFRALSENGHRQPTLTLRHLVAGAAREYQKLGRPITRSEFGEDFFKWVEEDIL